MQTNQLKKCPRCGLLKVSSEFYHEKRRKNGLSVYCKKCSKVMSENWRNKVDYRSYMARYMRNNYGRLRIGALQTVSQLQVPHCANCGCDFLPLLQINHKNGGGRREKQQYVTNRIFYRAIIKGRRQITDLNVLCDVCNAVHYAQLKYGKRYQVTYLENDDPAATA
jgi:hypothetical protein